MENRNEHLPNQEAEGLRAHSKKHENNSTKKSNRLWLWLGVLVLVFILLWWIFGIGTVEDLSGVSNG